MESYTKFIECVEGDVMIASAILSYFGPFPSEYREQMKTKLKEWLLQKKVKHSVEFKFVNFLVA